MRNENEVYIIEDIHPRDSFYDLRANYIGKKILIKSTEISTIGDVRFIYVDGILQDDGTHITFWGVKLRPVKSFWQKLFTWSW